MLILMRKGSQQDQAHIFQDTYFKSSQIHNLAIMYHFKHTGHIFLKFLFQNLQKLFLYVRNPHQQYLPYLSDTKKIFLPVKLSQVMMLY